MTCISYQIFMGKYKKTFKEIEESIWYLKELGVDMVWLSPVHEAPSYHGYDTTDYMSVKSEYGTIDDFKSMLKEFHKNDIKVIIDLVVCHTSIKHKWFKDNKDYYVWSDDDLSGKKGLTHFNEKPWVYTQRHHKYYFAPFDKNLPVLNHESIAVKRELAEVVEFWLNEIGIDGFRLDAVKHNYGEEEIEKSLKFWKWFKNVCVSIKPEVYLVGECWDEYKITKKYQDILGNCFDFDLQSEIATRVNTGRLRGIGEKISGITNTFLTNHDMDRVANIYHFNRPNIKLAIAIQMTLPGRHWTYYGTEICMHGDRSVDDIYVRQEMDWDLVNEGFKKEYSLLNFYASFARLREANVELVNGSFEIVDNDNPHCLSFVREYKGNKVYVIISTDNVTVDIPSGTYNVIFSNNTMLRQVKSNGKFFSGSGIMILK